MTYLYDELSTALAPATSPASEGVLTQR
jgi:hypothetical protein